VTLVINDLSIDQFTSQTLNIHPPIKNTTENRLIRFILKTVITSPKMQLLNAQQAIIYIVIILFSDLLRPAPLNL